MEIRINGKRAGANWADELMKGITEEIGHRVADHVRDSIPEGANVNVVVTDDDGNELTSEHAKTLRRGIEDGLTN